MQRKTATITDRARGCAFLVVELLLLLPGARAVEPMLAIRVGGGSDAVCAASEIERVGFEGGDTLVVVTKTSTASVRPAGKGCAGTGWTTRAARRPGAFTSTT